MEILIVGAGYVGFSNACLLSSKHNIGILDYNLNRLKDISNGIPPFKDNEIESLLSSKSVTFGLFNKWENVKNIYDLYIIATPTNYNPINDFFDTSSVENALDNIYRIDRFANVIIKSTIPIGYVDSINEIYSSLNIMFSPEFLREGKALHDNYYPSRIIIGSLNKEDIKWGELWRNLAKSQDVMLLQTSPKEAEAIKLFSNSYLAMRVAYFNELDTYCEYENLNSYNVIKGVSLDPRIGDLYNNPSFGYGGYCFPKDTKQLVANFRGIPQSIISAIVSSNQLRKLHIASRIIEKGVSVVGIYRIIMKSGSDNFRDSSIFDVILELRTKGIAVYLYEPLVYVSPLEGLILEKSLDKFKSVSEIILTNRMEIELQDVKEKVYTRDIFSRD
jgi:UDPglucose 6-dehydrogenase